MAIGHVESRYGLSFLTPVRGMLQPTLLDLAKYLPGRIVWKQALIEQYVVDEAAFEELTQKGWQRLNYVEEPALLFHLGSQLALVLALSRRGQGEILPELWARTSDILHAQRYPIALVHESNPREIRLGAAQQVVIGTHAIAFEQRRLYRYELGQLGELGQRYRQQIIAGLSPAPPTSSMHSILEIMQHYAALFAHAQDAAQALSELYWRLHEQHTVAPITYPVTVTDLPNIFKQVPPAPQKGYPIPATDALEAALYAISNAHDGGKMWGTRNQLPTYVHQREMSVTAVTIRRANQVEEATADVVRQLWERVNSYSDKDGDVLLAMLAQAVAVGPDELGAVWITSQTILDYRGLKQKRHETSESGEYRDAGHRPEDMREIAQAVERLREMHVSTKIWRDPRKPGGRRRKVTQESYLVLINDFLLQTIEGELPPGEKPLQIAWRYRPGEALGFPVTRNTKVAWLLQQTLHYDPYHQKWEKRLARYFMFQLRINGSFGGTTIKRDIGEILREAGLIDELDTVHPDRNRTHFEHVMHHLKQEGHISEWDDTAYFAEKAQLPSRSWLDRWLSISLEVSAAPLLEDLTERMLDQRHTKEVPSAQPLPTLKRGRRKGGKQHEHE